MTFNDIKDISDDEFIEFLKKHLPKDKIDEIYNNKLSRYEKKAYISTIIVLGSLLGVISIETLEAVLKEGVSLELTGGMLLGSFVLSYITINKLKQKELSVRKNKFNKELIDIKTNICNLTEEEFNILVSCYEYIIDNNLIDDDNINLNVLDVINKLVSINMVDILKEFEIKNNSYETIIYYEDEKENLIKTHIKGN